MSDSQQWPPDVSRLVNDIMATAKEPVRLPDCFVEWLRMYWMDNSAEEAERMWRESARHAFWVCLDYLRCVDAVLADPPADLIETLQENGHVVLYDRTVTPWMPYGRDEYIVWLRRVRADFERIVNEEVP